MNLQDPYTKIPPYLRRYPAKTGARTIFTWVAFVLLYVVLPAAFIVGISTLNATVTRETERADAFYQQTQNSSNESLP